AAFHAVVGQGRQDGTDALGGDAFGQGIGLFGACGGGERRFGGFAAEGHEAGENQEQGTDHAGTVSDRWGRSGCKSVGWSPTNRCRLPSRNISSPPRKVTTMATPSGASAMREAQGWRPMRRNRARMRFSWYSMEVFSVSSRGTGFSLT